MWPFSTIRRLEQQLDAANKATDLWRDSFYAAVAGDNRPITVPPGLLRQGEAAGGVAAACLRGGQPQA